MYPAPPRLRIFALLAAFSTTLVLHAQDRDSNGELYRKWTKAKSNTVIEAVIKDKKLDNSEVFLLLKNGKGYWIKTATLSADDQAAVKNWCRPVKHISARVVGSGPNYKNVEVVARASDKTLTVKAYLSKTGTAVVHQVAPGKELKFIYRAAPDYRVEGWVENTLVDQESALKKTGIGQGVSIK